MTNPDVVAQAEIDLVLEGPRKGVWAIEIKRTMSPGVQKGFRFGREDVGASHRFHVIPQCETFPIGHDTEAIALVDFLEQLVSTAGSGT